MEEFQMSPRMREEREPFVLHQLLEDHRSGIFDTVNERDREREREREIDSSVGLSVLVELVV